MLEHLKIVFIATTNRPADFDEDFLRRSHNFIYIGLPDSGAISKILQAELAVYDRHEDATNTKLTDLATDRPNDDTDRPNNGDQEARKGRPVIDIRDLNDLLLRDVYPAPLQSDVIARLRGYTHISVLNAASFFISGAFTLTTSISRLSLVTVDKSHFWYRL